MKILIAIVEDNLASREMLKEVFLEHHRFELKFFPHPNDFLMAGGCADFDLVLSDYSFGKTTLDLYLESFDRSKLIVFTGSFDVKIECLGVFNKMNTTELVELIWGIFKLSHSS